MDEEYLFKQPIGKRGVHLGVVVDGSQMTDKALALAAALWTPKRGDQYSMVHVSDPSKKDTPRHLQPQNLKSSAEHRAYDLKVRLAPIDDPSQSAASPPRPPRPTRPTPPARPARHGMTCGAPPLPPAPPRPALNPRPALTTQARGTKWLQRDREEDMSAAETLTALATDSSIDMLVVGSFRGKKGDRL
jgi:hypothetical protein